VLLVLGAPNGNQDGSASFEKSSSASAWRVLGIMVTMDDEQGVEAIQLINPETAIPIHYNDYDVFKSPLEDFKRTAAEAGLNDKIVYLAHGETYNFETPANLRQKASS
jgi:L-ascorbate metabolism protein UlaG (beta-lactamase superfamily)